MSSEQENTRLSRSVVRRIVFLRGGIPVDLASSSGLEHYNYNDNI